MRKASSFSAPFMAMAFAALAACSAEPEFLLEETKMAATLDPFAPMPDESEGLVNVSTDLESLLEHGALKDACARYHGGKTDRKTKLLCGKYMFFYESFGTSGVPAPLVHLLIDEFPKEIGPGFEKFGMIADPTSARHLPLGLAPSKKLGMVDTFAFSCASCHFGKLPDGRYAVGAPNHAYDYGKQNLALIVFPQVALLGGKDNHDPAAMAALKPLFDRVDADFFLRFKIMGALAPLLTAGLGSVPQFPQEAEHHYASWKPGTMDFAIEPLPINDGVHTVSKISALFGLPDANEITQSGMQSAMLGFTGGTRSLLSFVRQFVAFGGGDLANYPDDKLEPLVDYIHSLNAPKNPSPPDAALVAEGQKLFVEKQCIGCHDGPRGSGKRVYTFDEIGTDEAMKHWMDPDLKGEACCNAPVPQDERKMTHGIKSPRLVGLWAMKRFLHNGSVDSLDDLFCMNGPRGAITEPAYGDGGHAMTCDGLSESEKKALIAFLEAH